MVVVTSAECGNLADAAYQAGLQKPLLLKVSKLKVWRADFSLHNDIFKYKPPWPC